MRNQARSRAAVAMALLALVSSTGRAQQPDPPAPETSNLAAKLSNPISDLVSPATASNPRPPAPISPAMMTTDSAIMMVWLMPSRIDGRASGSCTFVSSCQGDAP